MVNENSIDVLIVGGGTVGALLALSLQRAGLHPWLIDEKPLLDPVGNTFDTRSFALSLSSEAIFKNLHLWEQLAPHATPISLIHVSQQGSFGSAKIKSSPNASLGHVIEVHHLSHVLHQQLQTDHLHMPATLTALNVHDKTVDVQTAHGRITIRPKLLVAADGMHSAVRQLCGADVTLKDYEQHAIVANVGLSRPHHNIAFERFTQDGLMACLPLCQQRISLVWVMPSQQIQTYMDMSEPAFLCKLQNTFGYRLGRLQKLGKRSAFPLQQVVMPNPVWDDWIVFLGNAQHTLHPIAAQGFNLSVRDTASLVECIVKMGVSNTAWQQYKHSRHDDAQSILCFTNGLLSLFGCQLPGLSMLRGGGLFMVDNSVLLKQILSRYAQGFGTMSSDLVCGIPLFSKEFT